MFSAMHAFINNYSTEPFINTWICTSILLENKQPVFFNWHKTSFVESYEMIELPENENIDEYCIQLLKSRYVIMETMVNNNNKNTENTEFNNGMITMKLGNRYNWYYINPTIITDFNVTSLKLDSVKPCLLSIEYTNPVMISSIILTLDKKYYVENNVILTPIFVRRLLEYQPEYYHFDMNYILKIMDNNIKQFTLTSKQSIKLTKTAYEII